MTLIELHQHLRNQEHMLLFAKTKEDKKYHKNLINLFANKMIRITNKKFNIFNISD